MAVNLKIPTTWNELTNDQLIKIGFLFFASEPSLKRDLKIFKKLNDIKWWQFTKNAKFRYFLRQVPYRIFNEKKEIVGGWVLYLNFLFKQTDRTNFIPTVKVGNKTYFAVMDRLQNLTADEFAEAFDIHVAYRRTKNVEYLNYLFHILYSETPERPEFDKYKLPKLINNKVPISVLIATEWTFLCCIEHLSKRYKHSFPKVSAKVVHKNKQQHFSKVLRTMAKGDLSKLPTIGKTNLYTFLNQFEEDIEFAKKQKK